MALEIAFPDRELLLPKESKLLLLACNYDSNLVITKLFTNCGKVEAKRYRPLDASGSEFLEGNEPRSMLAFYSTNESLIYVCELSLLIKVAVVRHVEGFRNDISKSDRSHGPFHQR